MGDMADFYSYGGYGACDYDVLEDIMENLTGDCVVERFNYYNIPDNYEYKELITNILEYYKKYHKLSQKQKYVLCSYLVEIGDCYYIGD